MKFGNWGPIQIWHNLASVQFFSSSQNHSTLQSCREKRLSPVIQGTWQARTVGSLEKEGSLPPGRMVSTSITTLWPTCLVMVRSSSCDDIGGRLNAATTEDSSSSPSRSSNMCEIYSSRYQCCGSGSLLIRIILPDSTISLKV